MECSPVRRPVKRRAVIVKRPERDTAFRRVGKPCRHCVRVGDGNFLNPDPADCHRVGVGGIAQIELEHQITRVGFARRNGDQFLHRLRLTRREPQSAQRVISHLRAAVIVADFKILRRRRVDFGDDPVKPARFQRRARIHKQLDFPGLRAFRGSFQDTHGTCVVGACQRGIVVRVRPEADGARHLIAERGGQGALFGIGKRRALDPDIAHGDGVRGRHRAKRKLDLQPAGGIRKQHLLHGFYLPCRSVQAIDRVKALFRIVAVIADLEIHIPLRQHVHRDADRFTSAQPHPRVNKQLPLPRLRTCGGRLRNGKGGGVLFTREL